MAFEASKTRDVTRTIMDEGSFVWCKRSKGSAALCGGIVLESSVEYSSSGPANN